MSYHNRVVETTPQIHINRLKGFLSTNQLQTQLGITDIHGTQTPYDVEIATTACYFGGRRHWFTCERCTNRAAILYLNEKSKRLFCRECSNLRYQIQNQSKSSRVLMRLLDVDEKVATVFNNLQRVQILYNGQPTHRFRRYLAKRQKAERLGQLILG